MNQDHTFIWTVTVNSLGGTESQGISRVGENSVSQVDGVSDMARCLLALWLCGGRAQKRDSGLCPLFCVGGSCPPAPTLMPDTSVPLCTPLVPFKLLPQCWSSEGVRLSKSMCGFFKGNCLELQEFLPPTQSPLVFAARSYGD